MNSAPMSPAGEALITIGITCHAEGDWLLECWKSVLAQTDSRWVAVLVMDGTEHLRTRQIFEQLQHPKLRKFEMPTNVGPYPARNKAFELTETPYHFYLDGDDQLMPDSVAVVLKTFERYPDAAFVYGDYECFGSSSEIWRHPIIVRPEDLAENQPTPGACAYKRQAWEQLGGFAAELARGNADYDFLIGAFEAGLTGYHCGRAFYRCRVGNPGRVSSSYGCRYHETHEIMVRRHPRFFGNTARRKRFLGLGYRRSALANRDAGNPEEAVRLAWAAYRHGMARDHEIRKLLLEGVLPQWVYRILRGVWGLRKAALGARSEKNALTGTDRMSFDSAIEAARIHTASYGASPDFRIHWLGFTQESRDCLAQQLRVFGELMGSVAQSLAGWKILDVGCGDGRWLRRMVDYDAKPEDVVGIDISDIRFEIGRTKNPLVKLLKTDGISIPFEDEHFDLVTQFVCFSNIPTVALRMRTAKEMQRVLKKGGYLFWWDLPRATAPSDRNAVIEPADYFDWPIWRKCTGQRPKPSEGLRKFPGARVLGHLLDVLGHSTTHLAALIGPKP